jgi:hypothetical protein
MRCWARHIFFWTVALALCLGAVACFRSNIHPLGDSAPLPPKSVKSFPLYENRVDHPYEALALVDSVDLADKTEADRRVMEEDLRRLAMGLGADAVHHIRLLEIKRRGAAWDEEVPFPGAWPLARYSRWFLRGEAIRWLNGPPDSESTPAPESTPPE